MQYETLNHSALEDMLSTDNLQPILRATACRISVVMPDSIAQDLGRMRHMFQQTWWNEIEGGAQKQQYARRCLKSNSFGTML